MVRMAKPDSTSVGSLVRYAAFLVGALCLVGLVSTVLHRLLPMLQVLVPGCISWGLWQRHCRAEKRRHKKLHTSFYRLLREHHGRMTLLDFAMTAEIPAIAARHYLDSRAQEFAARFEVTEQGDVVYVFSTLQFSHSQPLAATPMVQPLVSTPTARAKADCMNPSPASLTQAELAQRLGVAAKTISRKKHSSTLADWTQTRDPDGIAWSYAAQAQRFFPSSDDRLLVQPDTDRNA